MKRVFICSKLRPDAYRTFEMNVAVARNFMKFAIRQGCAPYAPHLLYPQCLDDTDPMDRESGIAAGIEFLDVCEELWYLRYSSGPSEGMKREIERAVQKGLKVLSFNPEEVLFEHYNPRLEEPAPAT